MRAFLPLEDRTWPVFQRAPVTPLNHIKCVPVSNTRAGFGRASAHYVGFSSLDLPCRQFGAGVSDRLKRLTGHVAPSNRGERFVFFGGHTCRA